LALHLPASTRAIFAQTRARPEENLIDLTRAIKRIYASILNPDALLYRRSQRAAGLRRAHGDPDPGRAGGAYGRYYLPHAAGVAFSRNLYRWSPQIRRDDGFLRLVWGLGTRAVDRVGNDYPRLVALSHPASMMREMLRILENNIAHRWIPNSPCRSTIR
jgi:hypothetical protein